MSPPTGQKTSSGRSGVVRVVSRCWRGVLRDGCRGPPEFRGQIPSLFLPRLYDGRKPAHLRRAQHKPHTRRDKLLRPGTTDGPGIPYRSGKVNATSAAGSPEPAAGSRSAVEELSGVTFAHGGEEFRRRLGSAWPSKTSPPGGRPAETARAARCFFPATPVRPSSPSERVAGLALDTGYWLPSLLYAPGRCQES